jgi:hypothetical protein
MIIDIISQQGRGFVRVFLFLDFPLLKSRQRELTVRGITLIQQRILSCRSVVVVVDCVCG